MCPSLHRTGRHFGSAQAITQGISKPLFPLIPSYLPIHPLSPPLHFTSQHAGGFQSLYSPYSPYTSISFPHPSSSRDRLFEGEDIALDIIELKGPAKLLTGDVARLCPHSVPGSLVDE